MPELRASVYGHKCPESPVAQGLLFTTSIQPYRTRVRYMAISCYWGRNSSGTKKVGGTPKSRASS